MRQGDRVVVYLPNSSLAVEAMLAAFRIRAVLSSTSPDHGVLVSWHSLIQYQYCVLLLSRPSNTDVGFYNPNCVVSCTRTVCDRSTSSMSMVSRYTHANTLPTHPHTHTPSHTTGGAGPIHSDQAWADLICVCSIWRMWCSFGLRTLTPPASQIGVCVCVCVCVRACVCAYMHAKCLRCG